MTLKSLIVALGLSVTTAISAAEPPAPPVFAARPRSAYTTAELAAWKNDPARSNKWAEVLALAGAAGDPLLSGRLLPLDTL